MGGDQSKQAEEYGGVYVRLNTDVFYPGDTVTGNVYINLKKSYPGDKLCFKIEGDEYTKWVVRERRTRIRHGKHEAYYVNVVVQGKRDIITQVITIHDWRDGMIIPPGQYNFPISFLVPKGLPGSFFLHSGSTFAEITYTVEAYLQPETNKVPKLTHKSYVTLRENLATNIKTREVTSSKQVKTCCCLDKGNVDMKTSFEKSAYAPGEEARIITEVDCTNCTVPIKDVKFSLEQTISLQAGSRHKTLNYTIRTCNMGGVQPGEKCQGSTSKIGTIQLPQGQEGSSDGLRGEHEISHDSFNPRDVITPSTNGVLVKSQFALKATSNVDGCLCCDSSPVTSLPVQIYSAKRVALPEPQAPVGWSPQQMPTTNLTIVFVPRADGGQDIIINQGGQMAQPDQNQMIQPSISQVQPYSPQQYGQPQPNGVQYFDPNAQYNQQYAQPQPYNQPIQYAPQYNDPNMQNSQQYAQPQPYGQPMQMNPQQVNMQAKY